ncbi:uncharacterized protein LOC141718819 [Apium graveolens]|uniref:uncharacterized protein LOC141718819 n=1 Tax=Apium graveolens TaxID=4045 RepID=UPI003D7BDB24
MISGGLTSAGTKRNSRKAYAREVMSIVGEPSKHSKSATTLEFGDLDLEGLKFPQGDPLIIIPIIGNWPVMRVLVDNGASVNILFHDTFLRMGYNDSQLTPSDAHIYGFNQVEFQVEGAIKLPVTIGEEPRKATQILNFQLLRWPLLIMPLWFPTRNDVGETRGDHKMARSFYVIALRPDGTRGQVLPIEDMDVRENEELQGKLAEDLVPIPLDSLDPEEVTKIFTWTTADMPGIHPNLITHKLNIDPTRKAVKRRKRTYGHDRLEAIKLEVEKHLEAGFIEEVQFLEWLATP